MKSSIRLAAETGKQVNRCSTSRQVGFKKVRGWHIAAAGNGGVESVAAQRTATLELAVQHAIVNLAQRSTRRGQQTPDT